MKSREVAAGKFKAVPVEREAPPDLRGSVVREGDLVSPIDVSWDVDR